MSGKVHQISLKARTPGSRGLPKLPRKSAILAKEGLEGDFNVFRHEEFHDDPDSAVLLIPLETIKELNDEGWPVKEGDLGENITTIGIRYSELWPGTMMKIGCVELQISRACDPCKNLYVLPYVGKEKGPEFLKSMLGRRGWYARVIKEGKINTGDSISVLGDITKS